MAENKDLCECVSERTTYDETCPQNLEWIIKKLVFLMYDPIAKNQIERQINLLDKFISFSPCAFWLNDIPYVIKILEYLLKRTSTVCLLKPRFKSLLDLALVPPLLAKASDVLEYSRDLDEYASFLGYMLIEVQEVELRDLILLAITNFLKKSSSRLLNSVSNQICLQSVERSELPSIVAKLLQIADDDLYATLLDICCLLVNISNTVCHDMMNRHALDYLLIRIETSNLAISSKVIYHLLEAARNETQHFKRNLAEPSLKALRSLQITLRTLTNDNNQIYRNYLMSILLLCMDLFPNMELNKSGLANDVGVLCSATEFGTGGTWITNVTFGTNDYDYEFKKMLILAVCYCTKLPSTLKIVHPKRVIPSLLRIINPQLTKRWHPDQQAKLVSMAINALHMLAQAIPTEFVNHNCSSRLLFIVEHFHTEPFDLLLLRDCLKSLSIITSIRNKEINLNLVHHSALKILIGICNKLMCHTKLCLNSQQCLTYGFCALEALVSIKRDKWEDSVVLCIKFMNRILKPNIEDPVVNPQFVICGLDFLWEAVVWNESNLEIFITNGGAYLLLDLIFVSPFPVKVMGLAVLVELCDAGTCIPHLITWRHSGQSLFSMLLTIFRDECLKLGVRTTYDGTLSDVEFPLMGEQQWYETFGLEKDLKASPATVDLLGSSRPKVYAIINLLYNRHNLFVELSNEHYNLFHPENLTAEDKITLLLAENFLALKLGEAWIEVSRDLENAGILPLAIDASFVAQLIQRFYKWSQHIQITQEKLLEQKFLSEYNTEMDLYNLLRDSKLIESLNALHELSYIARTTERMFRLNEKKRQCTQIEESGKFSDNAICHKTFMHDLQVTPVYNQSVSIRGNDNCQWEIPTPITDSDENESTQTPRYPDSLESGRE